MSVSVDYDPEAVMSNITGKYVSSVHELADELNKLSAILSDCEISFHCKGGNDKNAIMEIYQGFQTAIGKSNGNRSGEGLGGLTANTAAILNTVYSEAKSDYDRLQESNKTWK